MEDKKKDVSEMPEVIAINGVMYTRESDGEMPYKKDVSEMPEVIAINGVMYTRESDGEMPYKMVRGQSSGVFAGYLKCEEGRTVELYDARRIWYWQGAASLSELAMRGTSKPENCKFPCAMHHVKILDAIEIIDVTDEAKKSIASVPIWTR